MKFAFGGILAAAPGDQDGHFLCKSYSVTPTLPTTSTNLGPSLRHLEDMSGHH